MLCDRCRIIRKSAFVNGKSDTFKYMRICRYYFSALNNYYIIGHKHSRRDKLKRTVADNSVFHFSRQCAVSYGVIAPATDNAQRYYLRDCHSKTHNTRYIL